jgi:hypothetical protein
MAMAYAALANGGTPTCPRSSTLSRPTTAAITSYEPQIAT